MQSAEGSTINIWREVVQAFLVLAAVLFLVWVAAFATGCDGAATGKADLVTVEAQLATMPVDATIHIFREYEATRRLIDEVKSCGGKQ